MTTSTTDLCVQVERILNHHDRENHNRLAADVTSSADTLTVEFDATGLEKDAQLAIDFELLRVWARTDKTLTVERGDEGSTPAAHSGGARIVANPRFPRAHMLQAFNDELADLSSPSNGLFQVIPLDITYTAGIYAYDLAADFLEALDVAWQPVSSTKEWTPFRPGDWRVDRGLSASDFGSGNAIVLPSGISGGSTVRVTYKAAFDDLDATETDVAFATGLPDTALDILYLGAAVRLMAPLEPARNYLNAQGDSKRAEEVPPGAADRSVRALLALRDQRIRAEAARLRQQYPTVMR